MPPPQEAHYSLKLRHFFCSNPAFTLAEVLITLGIIGVVAALTIPNLIADYRAGVVETRLKKFYSAYNQAITMSITQNGEPRDWTYFLEDITDENGDKVGQQDNIDANFKKYIAPYMQIIEEKNITDGENKKRNLYILSDGSSFAYAYHENRDIEFFPKNGEKCASKTAEQRIGRCSFYFEFYPISNTKIWEHLYNKGMEAFMYNWNGNENTLYNDGQYGCNTNGIYCTAIIQRNGWKIPEDYPKAINF